MRRANFNYAVILFLVLLSASCFVYDGDTFRCDLKVPEGLPSWLKIAWQNMPIRVAGVDTPEIRTKNLREKELGRNAKRLAENLLTRAKVVELRNLRRGKYHRYVADVFVDGKSLADLLIKNNLAVAYDGGKKVHKW